MRRRPRSARLPPVEPLSRPAWDRVEAGVFDRMDRGEHLVPSEPGRASRAHAWLAAAAAAALVLAVWGWLPRAPAVAITGVSATDSAKVATATEAPTDTHIVTTRAPARTTFGGGALMLAPESEVHLSGSDRHGWLVLLDRGEIDCEVKPRQGRPPFVVQAGETRVSVVGTRFSVSRDGSGVRVSVVSGVVRVSSGFDRATLGAGQHWPARPEVVPQSLAPAPTESDRAAPSPPTAKGKARSADAGRLFAKAASLEPDNPRAAVAIYRRLSQLGGPWAANALYAEARLEHERGHMERAETLLRRYLKRHSSAPNRRDVEALLGEIDAAR